ncbi:MAG: glycine cleavage system aminomethyltransferase GcvT [Dehalococcoidia bacterium]|nr:glycine cleavage system aminomethyltransferase GcvT [Dehalococcoidia bacterium]
MVQPAPQSLSRTPLYQAHVALGARMVPFAGWEMPVQYAGGILAETRAVRTGVGMFDVSHMGRLAITGDRAADFLQRVLTVDARSPKPGRSKYGFVLNEQGGIVDDIILNNIEGADTAFGLVKFLLVCNAGNRPAVVAWLRKSLPQFPGVTMKDETEASVMIALQGPGALPLVDKLSQKYADHGMYEIGGLPSSLRPFTLTDVREDVLQRNLYPKPPGGILSRTGYTGEDGVEVILPTVQGIRIWQVFQGLGVVPCGLGARDLLRLEAAFPLHGNDIDPTTTPLEAGLERFVPEGNTEFIGWDVLERQRGQGVTRKLVGFKLLERGVPRHGFPLLSESGSTIGHVTSGAFSPTLNVDIGMGYVQVGHAQMGSRLVVEIRDRNVPAEIVPLPFYSRKR